MDITYLKVLDEELNIIKNNNIKISFESATDYKDKICVKPWGYEFLIFESTRLGIWYLNISGQNHGTSLHTHFKKDTLIIVLSGVAKITLINNEVISLGPLKSILIPKNKFHALSSFSDEVYLIEIEIFDNETKFSNKNDLLRINDKYERKKTGYESSIKIVDNLADYNYFYIREGLSYKISNTSIDVFCLSRASDLTVGYNILLSGELCINGVYYREGSVINKNVENKITYFNKCMILSINNIYAHEDCKLVYSNEQLNTIVALLKKEQKRIIMTSGCYDILHVGHIHNLREAKKMGDILIVCLSSDEQIKKLKGDTRPVNNYNDRINLFKTLSYVDYIVIYNEENIEKESTLGQIMKCVNPDFWVKGSDYSIEKIIDKHPYLKQIALIENIKEKSTTNIINKINIK